MSRCECDREGPHIYGPYATSFEMLELHRSWHDFYRVVIDVWGIERLAVWLSAKLERITR